MSAQIYIPNLDGLGLPLPLTRTITQFGQYINALLTGVASGTPGLTVVDTILTSSGTKVTVPSGAATDLAVIIRQDSTGGRTFTFDTLNFSATAPNIDTTASTISTFRFVKSGAKYVQIGQPTTGMTP